MPRAFVSRFETSDLGPEVYSRNAPRLVSQETRIGSRCRWFVYVDQSTKAVSAQDPARRHRGWGLSTRRPLAQSVVWPGLLLMLYELPEQVKSPVTSGTSSRR